VTNGDGLRPYIAALPSDSSLQGAERQRLIDILTRDGNFEIPVVTPTRRPVKRKAA